MAKLKVGKKSGLKYFGYDDIKSWIPCYDPIRHISDNWRGTAIDILKRDDIIFADRLWCVLRNEIASERVMRLFAVWSYRQTLQWISNPDPRSIEAANVIERFAEGKATKEELEKAAESAWSAAWSAWSAQSAQSAAWSAAESAWSAAQSAAWSAAESAWSAQSAAESAQNKQRDKLIEMLIAEGKERRKLK